MLEAPGFFASPLSPILDVADKLLKLVAVALGGLWTYWNYRKSRTYARKLELQLTGAVFEHNRLLYCEITLRIKNLGASKQRLQQDGSFCEVAAIFEDLIQEVLDVQPVFARGSSLEPGESTGDLLLLRLSTDITKLVWLRLRLRVASHGIEWEQLDFVRITP